MPDDISIIGIGRTKKQGVALLGFAFMFLN